MKQILSILALYICISHLQAQVLDTTIQERLNNYFINYQTSNANIGTCKLDSFKVNHVQKMLHVYPSVHFGYQPFTSEICTHIYRTLKQNLPGPVNYYNITVYADGKPIDELIPNIYRNKPDKSKIWKKEYKGKPWTKNISRPYEANKGLEGHHIALWQSHGKYYKNEKDSWEWQRPRLFCTTEDLFTQSFVVPYLIPMLENAGAIVFTPRERDWQRNEVIVDNDMPGSIYHEENSKKGKWENTSIPGFAKIRKTYKDGQNPFKEGTARYTTTEKKANRAFAQWIPQIPETGKYAVYVSYQTLPKSISDAKYIVFHKGGVTEFKVNQQMGGGTWVYLGSFEFDKGMNDYGRVILSNESKQKGVVCADAVRFGGGMGNIERAGKTSGLPRYLEGVRYNAQWNGMPDDVYNRTEGKNDYVDDINTRGRMINYLSGGSIYNPTENGLGIPFEMTLGFHSDAGFSKEDELIGSLGIYTTNFNDEKLNAGISRYTSRDLVDMTLTQLKKDISSRFGIEWKRRSMWNRNYSETRLPAVPSMILELLSHQNFEDMRWGHEPVFKFTVARSLYKAILKYIATMHKDEYVVQPLPIQNFAIHEGNKNTFLLTWQGTSDNMEPTARPKGYIVYTRLGYGGWDNGTYVEGNSYSFHAEPGLVYSFKVTAVNEGGESFPSEILSAYHAKENHGTILIVNSFNRTSGPASFNTPTYQGFDLNGDLGIPYINTPAYCGAQLNFNRQGIGKETEDGLGYSGNELEGMLIAGNTFDYPFIHGKAIQAAGGHSFISCSDKAIERGFVNINDFPIVDIIRGAEKAPFSPIMQEQLTNYTNNGGRLLISGSYVGSEMNSPEEIIFTENILKYTYGGSLKNITTGEVQGAGSSYNFPIRPNEKTYAVPAPDCLLPVNGAYSTFIYTPGNYSAAIAYKGDKYRTFVFGFPLESIVGEEKRTRIMKAILGFFE